MTSRHLPFRFVHRIASADFFYRAIGGAQVGPIDIWAQVFAANCAAGGLFDGRAVIGWNTINAPLLQHLIGAQAKNRSRIYRTTKQCNSPPKMIYLCLHVSIVAQEKLAMQINLAVTQEKIAATMPQ